MPEFFTTLSVNAADNENVQRHLGGGRRCVLKKPWVACLCKGGVRSQPLPRAQSADAGNGIYISLVVAFSSGNRVCDKSLSVTQSAGWLSLGFCLGKKEKQSAFSPTLPTLPYESCFFFFFFHEKKLVKSTSSLGLSH